MEDDLRLSGNWNGLDRPLLLFTACRASGDFRPSLALGDMALLLLGRVTIFTGIDMESGSSLITLGLITATGRE